MHSGRDQHANTAAFADSRSVNVIAELVLEEAL
jgi:hypothetical protein